MKLGKHLMFFIGVLLLILGIAIPAALSTVTGIQPAILYGGYTTSNSVLPILGIGQIFTIIGVVLIVTDLGISISFSRRRR